MFLRERSGNVLESWYFCVYRLVMPVGGLSASRGEAIVDGQALPLIGSFVDSCIH